MGYGLCLMCYGLCLIPNTPSHLSLGGLAYLLFGNEHYIIIRMLHSDLRYVGM